MGAPVTSRAVRRVVLAVCAAGIAGMIASGIADRDGAALTFGLVTAAAVACLMVATAVAAGTPAGVSPDHALGDDALATSLEDRVAGLVQAGADEAAIRALVADATRLGRSGTQAVTGQEQFEDESAGGRCTADAPAPRR